MSRSMSTLLIKTHKQRMDKMIKRLYNAMLKLVGKHSNVQAPKGAEMLIANPVAPPRLSHMSLSSVEHSDTRQNANRSSRIAKKRKALKISNASKRLNRA